MALQNGAVNSSKEPIRIDVRFIALSAMAVVQGYARSAKATHRSNSLMGFSQLISQGIRHRAWNAGRQVNFVERIAIPFEKPNRCSV